MPQILPQARIHPLQRSDADGFLPDGVRRPGAAVSGRSRRRQRGDERRRECDPSRREGLAERRIVERDPVQVLAAEIALQRADPAPAYQTYIALARETKDPRMAQRAAEIALRAQSPSDALTAAQLWHQFAPNSSAAGQLDASLLVLNGKLDDAQPLLAAQLATVSRGSAHQRDRLAAVADFTRAGSFGRRQACCRTC
ncbi:MAG: hypothetical protein WDN30_02415 [Pararobbsia sp.]